MMIDPLIAYLALAFAAAIGFCIAALLGANTADRRAREAYARNRHPAGRDLPSNVRSLTSWEES